MNTIKNMINYDLILLSNMKKTNLISMFFSLIACIALIFFGGSVMSFVVLINMAVIPQIIISNAERTGDCEQALGIIPISRRDIVISRFLLVTAFLNAVFLVLYISMEVSLKSDRVSLEVIDFLMFFLGIDRENVSERAFSRVFLGVFFAVAMKLSTSLLRNYFKNGSKSKKNSLIISITTKIILLIIIYFAVIILNASDVPIVRIVLNVLSMLISALMVPMDGAILFITTILIAFGFAAYNGVNAYIDYDKREL